jgi:hypothetical protein
MNTAIRLGRLLQGLAGAVIAAASLQTLAAGEAGRAGGVALLALAGVGGCLIAASILPRKLAWLGVACLSFYLPLLAFELFFTDGQLQGLAGEESKWDVVARLRRTGDAAYPAIFPTLFFDEKLEEGGEPVLPLSGLQNVTTVLCREASEWSIYKSDRHGFNNPDEAWDSADNVVIVGDSFVHGACLDPQAIFPSWVRGIHPGTLNLGMSDNGPLLMLATLQEYLPLTAPKAVVWVYYEGNDLYRRDGVGAYRGDLARELSQPVLRAYLNEGKSQFLAERETEVMRHLRMRLDRQIAALSAEPAQLRAKPLEGSGWRKKISLRQTTAAAIQRMTLGNRSQALAEREQARLARDAEGIRDDMQIFRKALGLAQQRASSAGAKALFLYIPSIESFTRPGPSHPLGEQTLVAATQAGFTTVDLRPLFGNAPDPFSFFAFGRQGGHYSPAGHALIGKALIKALGEAN